MNLESKKFYVKVIQRSTSKLNGNSKLKPVLKAKLITSNWRRNKNK